MLNPIMLDLKGRIRASCRTGGLLGYELLCRRAVVVIAFATS